MKAKLHIGVLILILTFLGVASQLQIALANQEIVLQFTEMEVSSDEAQNALSILKSQLQDLGADNINITEEDSGKLKITYYSNINVALVKESLFKEKRVRFNFVSNDHEDEHQDSSNSRVINYDIIINEIQNGHDAHLVFDGYVLEIKSEYDKFHKPVFYPPVSFINVAIDQKTEKATFKIWKHVDSLSDNLSYIFPEVRAGPQALRTS